MNNHTNQTWYSVDFTPILMFEKSEKIIFIIIAISTVVGNTLVLATTWKERKLHQPNKYFIACLAVADLLVGTLVAPLKLYIINLDFEARHNLSVSLCRFIVWVETLTLFGSIYTLAFISYDRFLKISKPLQYKSKMTTSKSLKMIFTIWLISNALAGYAASPYSGSVGILKTGRYFGCSEPDSRDNSKIFYLFLMISGVFLPFLFILNMYTLIFVVAHKRQKRLRNGELGESRNHQIRQSTFCQDLKVIRMLLVVLGMFIFCWFPFVIYNFLILYYPDVIDLDNKSLTYRYFVLISIEVVELLPLFNSAVIYACLDQTYKEAFKSLFQQMMYWKNSSRRGPGLPDYTNKLAKPSLVPSRKQKKTKRDYEGEQRALLLVANLFG